MGDYLLSEVPQFCMSLPKTCLRLIKRLGIGRAGLLAKSLMIRPFESRELLPVPKGSQIGPPDFVGIASGKAGTTWWWRLLQEHPSVAPNRLQQKELCYFYHFGYHGIDIHAIETYRQAFAAHPDGICGEWSPGYLHFPLAMEYLAKTVPGAKILAIVRNPVDRILSAYNQQLSGRARILSLKGDRLKFFETFSIFPSIIQQSVLFLPFQSLLKLFERSQVLLLQYEQCVQNPAVEIAKTYRFLGIDETFIPPSLQKRVNQKPYLLPKPKNDERGRLTEYFAEDVRRFGRLFPEIDLALWPDFART